MSRRRVARRGLPLPTYFESFSRARTRADADEDGRGEGWTRDATASARAARGCPVGCRDWSVGGGSRARGWMMLQRWLRARGLRAIGVMMETTSHASVGDVGARARRLSL